MIKVGITGGIGSGKTYISKMFAQMGVPVYYADDRAKFLMQNDATVIQQIISTFGEKAYVDNELNRAYLAQIVFQDKALLQELNNIVHPAVERDYNAWCELNEDYAYTIKEAALLFETEGYKKLDKLILVHADEDQRILRVMQRDKVSKEQVQARIKNQMSDLDKMELANFTINNDGNREVNKIVEKIHSYFSYSAAV